MAGMDWKELISTLRAAGYTQQELADACNCGQSTISELGKGVIKEPRDSIGHVLRTLASKAKRKAEKAVS